MDIKSFKEMMKRIFLALFIVAALSCKANPRVDPQVDGYNLKADPKQEIVAKDLVEFIESFHYKKVSVNDSLSSVVFDNFIKTLDEGRNYLLASDIKDFEQYRLTLDDDLRKGDL